MLLILLDTRFRGDDAVGGIKNILTAIEFSASAAKRLTG